MATVHRQSHSQEWDFNCWDQSPFTADILLDSLHTSLTRSDTRFPYWFNPRFSIAVSDVSFHKAICLQCINTEIAQDGAWTKEPHGFYTLTVQVSASLALPPQSPAMSLLCPSTWLVPPVFMSFVMQRVSSSWPLVLGSQPELNLQLADPANCTRCIPQHTHKNVKQFNCKFTLWITMN